MPSLDAVLEPRVLFLSFCFLTASMRLAIFVSVIKYSGQLFFLCFHGSDTDLLESVSLFSGYFDRSRNAPAYDRPNT